MAIKDRSCPSPMTRPLSRILPQGNADQDRPSTSFRCGFHRDCDVIGSILAVRIAPDDFKWGSGAAPIRSGHGRRRNPRRRIRKDQVGSRRIEEDRGSSFVFTCDGDER